MGMVGKREQMRQLIKGRRWVPEVISLWLMRYGGSIMEERMDD
jgi:hypothetical protein